MIYFTAIVSTCITVILTDGGKTIPSEAAAADIDAGTDEAELTVGTDEFISDAYNLEISDEDLMREMEALRASPGVDDRKSYRCGNTILSLCVFIVEL